MPQAANKIATEISIRFANDLDRLADALVETVSDRTIWESGDVTIIQETVTKGKQKINSRSAMGLDSAAWQGYQVGKVERFESSGEGFRWKLDPGANHCDDCLWRNAYGILTVEDVLTWCGIPANARTECNGGCRCDLVPA